MVEEYCEKHVEAEYEDLNFEKESVSKVIELLEYILHESQFEEWKAQITELIDAFIENPSSETLAGSFLLPGGKMLGLWPGQIETDRNGS